MMISVNQLHRSKFAKAIAFVAMVSFVFLFRPYCDIVSTADAATIVKTSSHGNAEHEHGQPASGDFCPALDHTSVALSDVVASPAVDPTPEFPLARFTDYSNSVPAIPSRIVPRATPPPDEHLPLYLRHARLLI